MSTPLLDDAQPGDLVIFRGTTVVDRLVRGAQRRRPSFRPWADVTHVALYAGESSIIEAVIRHVRHRPLVIENEVPFGIVPIAASASQRAGIVAFASSKIGQEYDVVDCALLGIYLATGHAMPTLDADGWWCSDLCLAGYQSQQLLLDMGAPRLCAPAALTARVRNDVALHHVSI